MKKLFTQLKNFLKTPEAVIIGVSLLITGLVSLIVGIGGYIIVSNFWGWFVLAFGVQFIIFAIINTFLQRKDQIEVNKIYNEQLEALSKVSVQIACAYCQTANLVPITLNQENRFKCESCNQVSGIKMQFFATQITTPLNKVLIPTGEKETIEFKTSLS
jgi:hypothetical protein